MSPSQRRPPRTQGTPAERLVRAFAAGDDDAVRDVAAHIIDRGLRGAFDVALRELRRAFEADAEAEFRAVVLEEAEVVEEPHEAAVLLVAGAIIGGGTCPDAAALAASLPDSGAFTATERVRFEPVWFAAADIGLANPCDIRAALRSMLSGDPPRPLQPASPEQLREGGVFALLGVGRQDMSDLPADPGLEADPDDAGEDADHAADHRETAAMDARSDAFEAWAERIEASEAGLLLIAEPCAPSVFDPEAVAEMAREPGSDGHRDAVEELLDFVEAARAETADKRVACVVAALDGTIDVEVRAADGGAVLDRRSFPLNPAEALPALRTLERTTIEQAN